MSVTPKYALERLRDHGFGDDEIFYVQLGSDDHKEMMEIVTETSRSQGSNIPSMNNIRNAILEDEAEMRQQFYLKWITDKHGNRKRIPIR